MHFKTFFKIIIKRIFIIRFAMILENILNIFNIWMIKIFKY